MSGQSADNPADPPVLYRLVISDLVIAELRALLARAKQCGLADEVKTALTTLQERLQVYPQFGQPLIDLQHEQAQTMVAVVPPLYVRYAIYETRREVWLLIPIRPLPNSGL